MGAEDRKLPAQELHQVDRERIVKLFEQLDINNDNTIDVQEIRNKLKEQGISLDHAEIIIEKCDKNKDGRIDVTEFVDYCIEKEKELWDVFHYIDTNKDGGSHYLLLLCA
jgi:Ca2+-binding EF-hand superfamily protein